ncbi:MAG: hypothetical protein KC619_16625 [Myxococcales bacterium]|nr:hypothetical protein [Myxococcales bacterium]
MAARLSASSLDLGTTDVHGTASGSVVLHADSSTGGSWAVSTSDAQFATTVGETITLEAGAQLQIPITFTPTTAGSHSATLRVTDEYLQSITCALTGVGSSDPWIDNDLTALDLGVTAVGASEVGLVTVCVPAGVSSVDFTYAVSGAGFTATPSRATISGGASGTILITFTPTAETTYTGSLTVTYTDDANVDQTFTVSLSGQGVDTDATEATTDESAGESATATASDASAQRATLYVPSASSLVSLGAPYTLDGTVVSQSGFTASSGSHVFFRAAGAATLQATGHAWFQSTTGSSYALAGENAYMVAGNQVIIGSKSLTGISAGFFGSPVDANQDEAEAGDPTGVSELERGFLAADICFGLLDFMLTVGNRYKDAHEYYSLKKWEEPGYFTVPYLGWTGKGMYNWLKFWGYAIWTLYQGVSFAVDRALGLPAYSTSLNSSAGILAGTPSITVLAATMSTTLSSVNTTVLGILGFSIESGYSSTLDSVFGDTLVNAGNAVTAIGAGESKVVTRFKTLSFLGTTVEVGNRTGVASLRQLPTKEIEMDGIKSVSIQSGLNAGLEAQLGAGSKLELESYLGAVKITSGVNTTIACVAGYKVEMTPAGVSISGSTGELVRLTAASITLGPAAAPILVSPAAVDLGNSTLNVSQSGITSLGQMVDLL